MLLASIILLVASSPLINGQMTCDPAEAGCLPDEECDAVTKLCVKTGPTTGLVCVPGEAGGCPDSQECNPATNTCVDKGIIPLNSHIVNYHNYSSTDPTCVDLHAPGRVSDCPQRKYLCDNSLYYDLMTVQCPKTCNRCPGQKQSGTGGAGSTGGKGGCVDLHAPGRVSDCPQHKHLCKNDLYKDVMKVQCPKTCGFC